MKTPRIPPTQLVDCSDTAYKGRTPDSRFLSLFPSRREERKSDNEGAAGSFACRLHMNDPPTALGVFSSCIPLSCEQQRIKTLPKITTREEGRDSPRSFLPIHSI